MNVFCDMLLLPVLAAGPAGWDPLWDGALSVGIFLAVLLLILAVFGNPGRIEISPERQAALLAGHTDRRTVFEYPATRPVMWLLLAASHRLATPKLKDWLRRQLVAAGSPKFYTPEEYLALAFLTGLILAGAIELIHVLFYGTYGWVLPLGGFAAGFALTLYQIHDQASSRIRLISKRLPYALDLIALAMGSGATFTEAVRTVTRHGKDDPFHVELRALLTELDLGTTRRRALQNLAARVPLESLQSIVASVVQAEELGSPLGDVLRDQATLLRLQRSVRAENAAAVASVRILIPCLLLVFAVILAIFGAPIVQAVRGGLF